MRGPCVVCKSEIDWGFGCPPDVCDGCMRDEMACQEVAAPKDRYNEGYEAGYVEGFTRGVNSVVLPPNLMFRR